MAAHTSCAHSCASQGIEHMRLLVILKQDEFEKKRYVHHLECTIHAWMSTTGQGSIFRGPNIAECWSE